MCLEQNLPADAPTQFSRSRNADIIDKNNTQKGQGPDSPDYTRVGARQFSLQI